jgi:hypothetical protein
MRCAYREVTIMGAKKTEKSVKSLLSSVMGPSRGVMYSLFILPAILARWLDPYYIDAGTAGMIVQGLIGLAVAGLAMGAVFRRRIVDWVKYRFKRSGGSEDEEDIESALPTEKKNESGE